MGVGSGYSVRSSLRAWYSLWLSLRARFGGCGCGACGCGCAEDGCACAWCVGMLGDASDESRWSETGSVALGWYVEIGVGSDGCDSAWRGRPPGCTCGDVSATRQQTRRIPRRPCSSGAPWGWAASSGGASTPWRRLRSRRRRRRRRRPRRTCPGPQRARGGPGAAAFRRQSPRARGRRGRRPTAGREALCTQAERDARLSASRPASRRRSSSSTRTVFRCGCLLFLRKIQKNRKKRRADAHAPKMTTVTSTEHRTPSSYAFLKRPFLRWRKEEGYKYREKI